MFSAGSLMRILAPVTGVKGTAHWNFGCMAMQIWAVGILPQIGSLYLPDT